MGESDRFIGIKSRNGKLWHGVEAILLPEGEGFDLKQHLASIEVHYINKALDDNRGVVAHAAKTLGLKRTTLVEKMCRYNIRRK